MIVAGFGFRAGATTLSLHAALRAALDADMGRQVTHLATLEDKAAGLAELVTILALPLIAVAPSRIVGLTTPTRSAASQAMRRTGSVSEACALAGAGQGGYLLGPRRISPDRMATCALAMGAST